MEAPDPTTLYTILASIAGTSVMQESIRRLLNYWSTRADRGMAAADKLTETLETRVSKLEQQVEALNQELSASRDQYFQEAIAAARCQGEVEYLRKQNEILVGTQNGTRA